MLTENKIVFSEKRDFGGILNATFSFLRLNIKELGLALLFIAGPFILLEGIISGYYQVESMNMISAGISDVFNFTYFLMIISQIFAYAVIVSVVYEYIILYLDDTIEKISVDMVWEQVRKTMISIFLSIFGVGLVILVGFIILIIPGLYFAVVLSLIWVIMIKEGKNFFDAFGRCFKLIKANWWRTAGLLIIGAIIQTVMALIFSLPMSIIVFIQTLHGIQNSSTLEIPDLLIFLFSVLASFSGIFIAVSLIILAFHYFSLVEEKEAEGLISKIDKINE